MNRPDLKFKDIRHYVSRTDRISICLRETMGYCNYPNISEVPADYDELYLYGFGIVESEFDIIHRTPMDRSTARISEREFLGICMEFMLSEKPGREWNDA